ncbi:MAG: fluoride efflux transporter CrcB [Actinobacteria bacterium]|nr:fluoride efflux transporter CrcB [Actinomycetota bacterium]
MRFVWVGLAGAAGAVTRYSIGMLIGVERFPWATLLINVTGSFALGFVLTFFTERHLSPTVSAAISVGFLGAYTTYSTFAWEGFVLGRTHRVGTAAIYVAVSIVGGLAAAWGGYHLARSAA